LTSANGKVFFRQNKVLNEHYNHLVLNILRVISFDINSSAYGAMLQYGSNKINDWADSAVISPYQTADFTLKP